MTTYLQNVQFKRTLDRWSKAAVEDLTSKQKQYIESMQWSGYTLTKVRCDRKGVATMGFKRCLVLMEKGEATNRMSDERREHIVDQDGIPSKGIIEFSWTTR